MIIGFAGDWHGNFPYTRKALNYASKNGADVIIHVGDFGVWSPYSYISAVGDVVERLQPKILVHGHYHVSYSDMLDRTIIRGLDCDGRPLDKNIWLLDTKGLGDGTQP